MSGCDRRPGKRFKKRMDDQACYVTCKAPVNIAVIKYWGKRNEELLLPLNDSISLTLDENEMYAKTTICASQTFTEDRMWLNGQEVSMDNPRIKNCLKAIRQRSFEQICREGSNDDKLGEERLKWHIHVSSVNNFPTAAGLASSAAGYACFVYCLSKLYNISTDVSDIARLGSGSACRSLYGGFVHWFRGKKEDGSDSIARQIAPPSHWPELHVLILVVSDNVKPTSSTDGMKNSTETSELLQHRINSVIDKRLHTIVKAIQNHDFQQFAKITMQESNQFHAICLDTWPPIKYLTDISFHIITLIHKLNTYYNEIKVAYTFDAGPNAVLFLLEPTIPLIYGLINHYYPSNNEDFFKGILVDAEKSVPEDLIQFINSKPQSNCLKYVIHTKVGKGPTVLDDDTHLLDEDGYPVI